MIQVMEAILVFNVTPKHGSGRALRAHVDAFTDKINTKKNSVTAGMSQKQFVTYRS